MLTRKQRRDEALDMPSARNQRVIAYLWYGRPAEPLSYLSVISAGTGVPAQVPNCTRSGNFSGKIPNCRANRK